MSQYPPPPPQPVRVRSEGMSVASPMSFVGATERLTGHWWGWLLLPVAWGAIVCWYLLFGVLVVPWRLLRRGARKRKVAEQRHRELMGQHRPSGSGAVWER